MRDVSFTSYYINNNDLYKNYFEIIQSISFFLNPLRFG